jgi:hypothetical protein
MLEKECKYQKGVYKVQTFRTTQSKYQSVESQNRSSNFVMPEDCDFQKRSKPKLLQLRAFADIMKKY